MFMKAQTCMSRYMSVPCTLTYLNVLVCRLYIHVHAIIHLYVHGTHTGTFMNVNLCMDIIQTRLYKFTTTLHFPSLACQIRLATVTLASLSSTQEPLLLSSLLPVISLFN